MGVFGAKDLRLPQHKIDSYLKFAELIQWGRRNPLQFVSRFFGIDLLDYQKYVFMKSWITPFCLWCQSRSSGKTTLAAPFIMAKTILIPNFQTYILAGVGSQSKEVFIKIEKIAKREIASFTGLNDIFYDELVRSTADKDGFTHNPNSFQFKVYHGSAVNSLNSSPDALRSKRSNLNFYDESGFTPDDVFTNSKPFITQNADFKLGGGIDATLFPKSFPNQIIMASSASGEDTYFWRQYKEYAHRMIIGDKNYFVADIDSDVVMSATFNGKIHLPPLLTQDVIDEEMRKNPQKALREYKNIFDTDGGDAQIIKRAAIIKNSSLRPPTLYNSGMKKFVFAYDPARSFDNSVLLVAELIWDEKVGYRLEICNGISFADQAKKKKTPMRYPEQRKLIKELILDYNGKLAADYENIEVLLIDAGSGGGGVHIVDELMEDWTDKNGNKRKGLIDAVHNQTAIHRSKFPNAADKIRLIEPMGNQRGKLFETLIESVNHDLISFTESYDGRPHLIFDKLSESGTKDENGEKHYDIKESVYKLSPEEKMALVQIDLLKEEMVNIYRFENTTSGRASYGLPANKRHIMNDDRVFCIAMMAWYLQQLRHKEIVGKPKKTIDKKRIFSKYRKVSPYGAK